MAEIRPFRGYRYNLNKAGTPSRLVTQPYDKITPEMQKSYYEMSPYNFVRLILNASDDPYEGAKKTLERWINEGILIQDNKPGIYPYYQAYRTPWGEHRIRRGFVTLLKLEEFTSGVVLPHEKTLPKPKEDRYKLLSATKAHLGQIFMLYPDKELKIVEMIDNKIKDTSPLMETEEHYEPGVTHRLWYIDDEELINEICKEMLGKHLLIADGHHRYETALLYSKEHPGANYVMVTLVSMDDPGLLILPTHRAIKGVQIDDRFWTKLREVFNYREVSKSALQEAMHKKKKGVWGLYINSKYYLLEVNNRNRLDELLPSDMSDTWRDLDVVILHKGILEPILGIPEEPGEAKKYIDYLRYEDEGVKGVDEGKYTALFLLNPVSIKEVEQVGLQGEKMPPKSTDFYPKLISGLVLYKFE